MNSIGQIEKKTQQRVKLFRDALRYDYLGDWTDNWRQSRKELNAAPLAHESWSY